MENQEAKQRKEMENYIWKKYITIHYCQYGCLQIRISKKPIPPEERMSNVCGNGRGSPEKVNLKILGKTGWRKDTTNKAVMHENLEKWMKYWAKLYKNYYFIGYRSSGFIRRNIGEVSGGECLKVQNFLSNHSYISWKIFNEYLILTLFYTSFAAEQWQITNESYYDVGGFVP